MFTNRPKISGLACALSLLAGLLFATSNAHAIVSTFTGGDAGEGLDLQGHFSYAVNVQGVGGLQVGDALFTSEGATPGYAQNAPAQIAGWATPSFGATANDNNLETVMRSIRHGAAGGQHIVDLSNLEIGKDYKLQLLYTESCCNRAMDVLVNGVTAADNFNIPVTQGFPLTGDSTPANGAVVIHEFTAFNSSARVVLDGPGAAAAGTDLNPTLSGLTLERLGTGNSFDGNVAFGKSTSATSTFSGTFNSGNIVDGIVNDAQGNQWLAVNGVTEASVTIDLDGSFSIDRFELLNTGNAGFLDRATGTFSIDVAGADGVFFEALSERTLQFNDAGFQIESVDLNNISQIRFNMLSIADPDNGGQFPLAGGGLNELRAIGHVTVPEPTTALLGMIGLAGLAQRRRRAA